MHCVADVNSLYNHIVLWTKCENCVWPGVTDLRHAGVLSPLFPLFVIRIQARFPKGEDAG